MALLDPYSAGGLFQGLSQGVQQNREYNIAQQGQETARMNAVNAGLLPAKTLAAQTAYGILNILTDPERFATVRDQGLVPFLHDMVNGLGQTAQTGDWSSVTGLDSNNFQKIMTLARRPPSPRPPASTPPPGSPNILIGQQTTGVPGEAETFGPKINGAYPAVGLSDVTQSSDIVQSPAIAEPKLSGGGLPSSAGYVPTALEAQVHKSFPNSQLVNVPALLAAPENKGFINNGPDLTQLAPFTGPNVPPTNIPDTGVAAPPRNIPDTGNQNQIAGGYGPVDSGLGGSGIPPISAVSLDNPILSPVSTTNVEAVGAGTGTPSASPDQAVNQTIKSDPDNPLNSVITSLSDKISKTLADVPSLPKTDANALRSLYLFGVADKQGNQLTPGVLTDPGYVQARNAYLRAIYAGGYSPTNLSYLRNQMNDAFVASENNANRMVGGLLAPYITSANIFKNTTAGLKDLGEAVKGESGAIKDVSDARTQAATQIETARHQATQDEIDAAKPLLSKIDQKWNERSMAAQSLGGGINLTIFGAAGIGARGNESQRNMAAQMSVKQMISDVLALRELGLRTGNKYAQAVADGYLKSLTAEYNANPSSVDVVPPNEDTLLGLDYIHSPASQRSSIFGQADQATKHEINRVTGLAKAWEGQTNPKYQGPRYENLKDNPGGDGAGGGGGGLLGGLGAGVAEAVGNAVDAVKNAAKSVTNAIPKTATGKALGQNIQDSLRLMGIDPNKPIPPQVDQFMGNVIRDPAGTAAKSFLRALPQTIEEFVAGASASSKPGGMETPISRFLESVWKWGAAHNGYLRSTPGTNPYVPTPGDTRFTPQP